MSARKLPVINLTSDAELRLALMRARELEKARIGSSEWLEWVSLQRAIAEFMGQRRAPGTGEPD
ncbi:hypothetical protein EV560_105335 [Bosea sp. BK604]|nr:hypothetical protein EV560_105335 [Bosea sp. BK604]